MEEFVFFKDTKGLAAGESLDEAGYPRVLCVDLRPVEYVWPILCSRSLKLPLHTARRDNDDVEKSMHI